MSWTGDLRCLYCDGKLPLLRKITNGQFCSAQHRKMYWEEQERLGLERLHQTHSSLRAVNPQAEEGPAVCGIIPAFTRPQPVWPSGEVKAVEPSPFAPYVGVRLPLRKTVIPLVDRSSGFVAGVARLAVEPRRYQALRRVEPIRSAMLPTRDVASRAVPQGDPFAQPQTDAAPRQEKLLALARPGAKDHLDVRTRREPWPATPFLFIKRPYLPWDTRQDEFSLASAQPELAGLLPVSLDQVPLVHGTWIDNLRALDVRELPSYELATPALRPRLKLAAGSRYPVATRDAKAAVAAREPENLPAPSMVAIPQRKVMAMAAGAGAANGGQVPAPGQAGLLPLAKGKANEPPSPRTAPAVNLPQPLKTEPMRPASRLEPVDAKPSDAWMPPPSAEERVSLAPDTAPSSQAMQVSAIIGHAAAFWKQAPRDLKLLMFGIPILLGLALHPSLKKIPYTAPQQTGAIQKTFESKLQEQWRNVKQSMVDRAAIALDEDFRTGLDDWTSRGGTTEWEFDATGFVKPGPLALYRPSVDLTDYQLQFLGMIDKKALSWVVRAADFDDYYVVKLVVMKPAPVPTVGVVRYAVIHGVAQDRADTVAYINAREDMLYRVRMDIHGDVFALTVQGQLVDSWTEPRLRKGGIGFFTARGEASRLRWVQVTHQYDMLGRLCAYLAPYDIPSTNGGWQP